MPKRPPWTLFPRRGRGGRQQRHDPPLTDNPTPKRLRLLMPAEVPESATNGAVHHHVVAGAICERSSAPGRTVRAAAAGRQQQWRRPCQPLPVFQRKVQKGHILHFTDQDQWQGAACPCPSGRLTTKRCSGDRRSCQLARAPSRPATMSHAPGGIRQTDPQGRRPQPTAQTARTSRNFSYGASGPQGAPQLSRRITAGRPSVPTRQARKHTLAIPCGHEK